jgi:hypothetical protein
VRKMKSKKVWIYLLKNSDFSCHNSNEKGKIQKHIAHTHIYADAIYANRYVCYSSEYHQKMFSVVRDRDLNVFLCEIALDCFTESFNILDIDFTNRSDSEGFCLSKLTRVDD